jgi:hypothetical protein
MTLPYAAGALGSTVDDLVRWDAALREHQILDRVQLEQMYTPVTLSDGTTENYGFGWGLGMYYGHPILHHGGGIHGFRTYIARFPEAAAAVILLSNFEQFDPERLGRRIGKLILGIPPVEHPTVALDEQLITKVTGTYADANGRCEVAWDGRLLKLTGPVDFSLLATSPSTFIAREDDDVEIRFADEEEGRFNAITVAFPFFTWSGTRTTESSPDAAG